MANDVRSTGRTSNVSGSTDSSLASLLEALKSGDTDAAASAVGALLRGRGANITGSPKDKGFGAQLKQAFNDVKDRLTGPERKAVTEALAKTEKPAAAVTNTDGETRTPVDSQTVTDSRRRAIQNRALEAAVAKRLPIENAGEYVGRYTPQEAAGALDQLNQNRDRLQLERGDVQGVMKELGGEIGALEGRKRTPGEDLLLQAKQGQLAAFTQLDKALDGRLDQMNYAALALARNSTGTETGEFEISREEVGDLVRHGSAVDRQVEGAAKMGNIADRQYMLARDAMALEKPAATETKPAATETKPAATETKPAATETKPAATETKPADTTAVEGKKLLPQAELDKTVTAVAIGVGTDKSKINSASAIFKALDGKSPEQIAQIKDAYNAKYATAGKDANGSWEAGWDFDKNVRGNMHSWNKQAFDALAAGKPEAKQMIADGAKKDQEVNAGKIKADFAEPVVAKPTVTVKEGDWLSRIAANAKNKDGTSVTLDQLRAMPENKYIFDRNGKGDLIHPGDKVTLPDGSTHPAAELAAATPETKPEAKPETKTAPGKVKTGIKKPDAEVKPEAKPTEAKPEVTYAQLSEKQVNDAVGAIATGVGAAKGEMKSATQVFDAVNGMSPNQLTQVKDAYNKKFGAQGWDFDKHVKGAMFPWNQKAFEALEKGDTAGAAKLREDGKKLDAQVATDTKKLRDAVEGGGTSEKAIFDVLKKHQSNPEMLRAIESQYKRDYKEDLRSRVDAEMKGGDVGEFRNTNDDAIRAKALFDGKPNVASAALLHSLLADGSSNAEVALQVMTKEITPERRKAVADEFKKLFGKTPEQMVREWPMWDGNAKADLIIAARDMSR
jgi:Annexin